jgi:hypothetical protein
MEDLERITARLSEQVLQTCRVAVACPFGQMPSIFASHQRRQTAEARGDSGS